MITEIYVHATTLKVAIKYVYVYTIIKLHNIQCGKS